jgi:predicted DNA binding CopG/RHH family protein
MRNVACTLDRQEDDMDEIEREIQRLEEENAWDESDEVVEVEFQKPLAKVIPVRMPSEAWEALRIEARNVGVGPTTLARMWLLERLRQTSHHRKAG